MVAREDRLVSALIVLALNSGSSSLKFGLYRVDSTGAEKLFGESIATTDHPDAITRVASVPAASGMPPPDAIGHRIVHGGPAPALPHR
jgi:acetate kinase